MITCIPLHSPHSLRNETSLHTLVRENQYDSALARIHKHPEEVSSVDCLDRTPLHELCDKRNPDQTAVSLAEAIVSLRPELVGTPDSLGWTPLHYCLQLRKTWTGKRGCPRSCSDSLALVLIHAHPEAVNCVRETSNGLMTPFHLACQNDAHVAVLRAMLEINPALASQHDNRGSSNNPIHLMWRANQSAMDKLALLLLTAFKGRVVTTQRHLLHASCCQQCPPELVLRIMETYPASERDDRGNLPLHYAIRGLEDLIVIRRLVAAYPEALYTLDADTLYPVLACALRATESRFHLSLTFELLLAAPDIVLRANQDTQYVQDRARALAATGMYK